MTDHAIENEKAGCKLAVDFVTNLNVMGYEGEFTKGFLKGMDRSHRTLQANVGRVVIAWLQHLRTIADLGEGHYDMRNAGLVKFAQSIGKQLDEAYVPFI